MPSFRELLAATKADIDETDPAGAEQAVADGALVLDIREPDEVAQGESFPGSTQIVRGNLESQVEARITDKSNADRGHVCRWCAIGVRSEDAHRTRLHRRHLHGRWVQPLEGRGSPVGDPRPCSPPISGTATAATSSCRRWARRASRNCSQPRCCLLGAGGLGSPAALYLAAAGVGTLGIIDMDVVDESNLQRQILHNLDRVGERKVDSAKTTLTRMNPDIEVITYDARLGADNIEDIIAGYDVVIDGADNFPSRYLLNDASVKAGIPVVHGSIFRFEGPGHRLRSQRTVPPTATYYRSPLRPSSPRAAPKPAWSACCRASSARSRRSRRSS